MPVVPADPIVPAAPVELLPPPQPKTNTASEPQTKTTPAELRRMKPPVVSAGAARAFSTYFSQGFRIVMYQGAGLRQLPQIKPTSHVPVSSIPGNAAPVSSLSWVKSRTEPDSMLAR